MSYKLEVQGQTYQGQTDSNGMIIQVVAGSPSTGKLTLGMWSCDLTIQPLPAIDSEAGYSARLSNLGYYPDDAAKALMRFQSANELDISGKLDDDTQSKLKEVHGH